MARSYIHSCDGCDTRVEVEEGPFMQNALPDGWIQAGVWPGNTEQTEVCSWACMAKAAKKRAKDAE